MKLSEKIIEVTRRVEYWMELRITVLILITKVIKDDSIDINNRSNNKSN